MLLSPATLRFDPSSGGPTGHFSVEVERSKQLARGWATKEPLDAVAFMEAMREAGDVVDGPLVRFSQSAKKYSYTVRNEEDTMEYRGWGDPAKAKAWLLKWQTDLDFKQRILREKLEREVGRGDAK